MGAVGGFGMDWSMWANKCVLSCALLSMDGIKTKKAASVEAHGLV